MDTAKITEILTEAKQAASIAAKLCLDTYYAGEDMGACGFAWMEIVEFGGKKIDGRSKIAKALKAAGVEQNWERVFSIWNPSDWAGQNIDVKEAGARAAAAVFEKYGFRAYAASRLD